MLNSALDSFRLVVAMQELLFWKNLFQILTRKPHNTVAQASPRCLRAPFLGKTHRPPFMHVAGEATQRSERWHEVGVVVPVLQEKGPQGL